MTHDRNRKTRRRVPPAAEASSPIADSYWCSFCGAAEADVQKMIAGDRAQICDRCLQDAVAVLLRQASDPRRALKSIPAGSTLCGFCHSSSRQRSVMVGSEHVVICDQCLAGIVIAVAQELSETRAEPVLLSLPRAKAGGDEPEAS